MIFYNRPAILFNDYLHNYSFPRYISMEFDDLTAWRIFKYYLVYEDLNANPTQNLTITKVFSILDKLKLFEGLRKPNLYKSIEKASKITESMKKKLKWIFFLWLLWIRKLAYFKTEIYSQPSIYWPFCQILFTRVGVPLIQTSLLLKKIIRKST